MWVRRSVLAMSALLALSPYGCGDGDGGDDAGFFVRDGGPDAGPRDTGARDGGGSGGIILVDLVFDGDTIRVRAGSTVRTPDGRPMNQEHIRLLGVDAPEVAHPEANPPRPDPDCWGDEAAAYAQSLLGGKVVRVEFDPTHDLRDDFGRLLGYVILDDDRVANEVLIRQGQATSFRAFRHRDLDRYNDLEGQARDERLGLWSTCR